MDPEVEEKTLSYRIGQLKEMAFSKTSRNAGITFAGNMIASFLSVVSVIFISRALGPEKFGIVAIYSSLVATLLGITDFGLGTAAVKLIAARVDSDKHWADVIMKVIFKLEMFSGLILGVVGLLFSSQIANLLGGQQLLFAVRLGFLAGAFTSAGAFVGPFLVAHEQFIKNVALGVIQSVLKITGVLALVYFAAMSQNNIMYLYAAVSLIGLIIGVLVAPKGYLAKTKKGEQKKGFFEVFDFGKWVLLSYIATAAIGKLDVMLLSRYQGATEVGLYSAAQQLTNIIPILIGALSVVILPRLSKMKTRHQLMSYIKKAAFGLLILAGIMLLVLPFSALLINIIFGSKFALSIDSFKVLYVGYVVALVVNPISLVMYALNRPPIFTGINTLQLVLSVGLNLLLIPSFGRVGASYTFLIVTIISSALSLGYSIKLVKAYEGVE